MSSYENEKINNKVLIMYILDKIEYPILREDIVEICCSELNADYFSTFDCLFELVESGHVLENKDKYSITLKGKNNVAAIYDSLPYSTRKRADKISAVFHDKLSRQAMIVAEHNIKNDVVKVHLELSDGKGQLLNLEMLCPNENAALDIEKKFDKDAETYYLRIFELFQ